MKFSPIRTNFRKVDLLPMFLIRESDNFVIRTLLALPRLPTELSFCLIKVVVVG